MGKQMRTITPDELSQRYRQQLRLMATDLCEGKDPVTLSKYELIERLAKVGQQRDQYKNAAVSFECQLFQADPHNAVFANYPPEKLAVMEETVARWQNEIAEARRKAEASLQL
ncbi:MAG TPA: hypothetical protein VKF42_09850 [Chitinivibrionales bacterium]|nr:hypothetical protein [Chitinivibrionales bacterium]